LTVMLLVIPLFIPHRGCPHDCLFCNQQEISGAGRAEGLDESGVRRTVDLWLGRKQEGCPVQVAFFGGSFTCLPEKEQLQLLSAVQPYISSGEVDTIRLSTRPDCIDQTVCTRLKEYNVGVVELGAQSMNDEVLRKSCRGHSAEQVRTALHLLKGMAMEVGLQLMPGLPGETTTSFFKTIDEVINLAPDFVRIYPTLVVRDSGLEKLYRNNCYRPLSLAQAVAICARCCRKLNRAGIKVVRMGLQPSVSLEKSLIAGPYHPAFGELVQSRLWLQRIRKRLGRLLPSQKLVIHISHKDMSAVVGMRKQNTKRLEELGFSGRYQILPDRDMARGSVRYAVS